MIMSLLSDYCHFVKSNYSFVIMRYLAVVFVFLVVLGCGESKKENDKQRFLIKGNGALDRGEFKDALRYYNGALALDSCYVEALNNIGVVYFESGKYIQAIQYYDEAMRCNPEHWDTYINRASTFYESNELYRALDDLEFLQRKTPDSAKV